MSAIVTDGTTRAVSALALSLAVAAVMTVAHPVVSAQGYTPANCPAAGNAKTRTYYVTGDRDYWKLVKGSGKGANQNLVCFNSFREAERAGYRRWQPIAGKAQKRQ